MKRTDAAIGNVYYVRDYAHVDIVLSSNISIGFNVNRYTDLNHFTDNFNFDQMYKGWKQVYRKLTT